MLIVQKYGGSSLSSIEKIQRAGENIKNYVNCTSKVIVVVSAMGHHTDQLLKQAKELSQEPPKRELDMLLSTGERISMALLAIVLSKLKVPCLSLTGSQSGILTDENHGNARIYTITGPRIKKALEENRVVIVAGFQGVSLQKKEITTLGRGGSDLTAVALASVFRADVCQIYTDVPGVMNADPDDVPDAKVIPFLSWRALQKMAWCGAGVMHHRAAAMARKFSIPLQIRPSFNFSLEGTMISATHDSMISSEALEGPIFQSITSKQNLRRLCIKSATKDALSLWNEALQWFWAREESPFFWKLTRESAELTCWHMLLSAHLLEEFKQVYISKVLSFEEDWQDYAGLCLIGSGFRQSPEVLAKLCQLCSEDEVKEIDMDDEQIALVVKAASASLLQKKLHAGFLATT